MTNCNENKTPDYCNDGSLKVGRRPIYLWPLLWIDVNDANNADLRLNPDSS